MPRRSSRCEPRPASQPSTRGSECGSCRSYPLATSSQRAVSRTDRVSPPIVTVSAPTSNCGPRGIRPYVVLRPTSPQNPAGMRIDPPPSPPVASVTMPPATAAADPPDEPPGVRPCCHGLCVTPLSTVRVRLTPPNSLAVVSPNGTAPPVSRSRSMCVSVWLATRSRNGTDASVSGQPATWSSSFTASGTPPNGRVTSACSAAASAPSGSRNENAFSVESSIAASVARSSETGSWSPERNASTRLHASPDQGLSVMGWFLSW